MTESSTSSKPVALPEPATPWSLLHAIARIADAPLSRIAERLREAVLPYAGGNALVIFTEECTGRPQKKVGDEEVIAKVTITELQQLREALPGESAWSGSAFIAGTDRQVLAITYPPSNALLVITYAGPLPDTEVDGSLGMVRYLWELAAHRIKEKVSDAAPSYLVESRAASAERLRVTSELVDLHSTTLETLLAASRSPSLDDASARASVTDVAARALVELRTHNDRTTDLVEEPVASAFERLRDDLRPLTRYSGIDVQFMEPPLNGRALPGEVATAARAIVRGLLLSMLEQQEVRRVRTQWDCDGENLLINVRDDGDGRLSTDAPAMGRLQRRVQALSGRMEIDLMPGWGADISVVLPLDPPASPGDVSSWNLAPRELEVLQLLAAGKRNRNIAASLNISENTVKFHVRNLFRKLQVTSRSEAIAIAHAVASGR
ncbi:helix-turn-helix transcriptional regulator [Paenarthrobacter ureafaciens]|uniref:helix-turn-helix transcriptional regulator n=1 Tax=Paenarthrobacter ureafaciens TaxID=37931 RepID=UPI002DBCE6C5|nr:LuxR C-terminal-related transcriptional regulator [Paenarthrobacter ureafaciens]MEC3853891.1 LuxR C-terminal-related transcriptional regulator [Paenarthrobacter ureafaciens]